MVERRTPEQLFQLATHYSKHMTKPDMDRVDELHAKLAPLVDDFKPADEELLSVLAAFVWNMAYNSRDL